jgi:hypothetical protein
MIAAASDPLEARAIVDRAESSLGWDDLCSFCAIMLAVPASIACARASDVDSARRHLAVAERWASLWHGTSWEAGIAEAQAAVAAASGDTVTARTLMQTAAAQFLQAGQPLDAERCGHALAEY